MKAMLFFAPGDIQECELPLPDLSPLEALVRIESTGICGSDLHYYTEGRIGDTVVNEPLVLGHEYAGIIERVGDSADKSLVGKRVAVEPGIPCLACEWCRTGHYNVCPKLRFPGLPPNHGALAEYIAVHAAFCFPVPENMDASEAALIEPLAVAVHTVELAHLRPGDSIAVLGLGPIGLMTAAVARIAGASTIYGTDLLPYRLAVSSKYGVDKCFNASQIDIVEAILGETKGRGVDAVLDCARSTETPAVACRIAKPAGRVVLTGISGQSSGTFPVDVARRKELSLVWCRRFLFNYPYAIHLASSQKIDLGSLITHRFPLSETKRAFDIAANYSENVLKISIDQL